MSSERTTVACFKPLSKNYPFDWIKLRENPSGRADSTMSMLCCWAHASTDSSRRVVVLCDQWSIEGNTQVFMEAASLEIADRSAIHKWQLSLLFMESSYYLIPKSSWPDPLLSQFNPVDILTYYLFKTEFDIALRSEHICFHHASK
jgi:hypothetical protein